MAKGNLRRRKFMKRINRWRYDDPYFFPVVSLNRRTLKKPNLQKKAIMQMMIFAKKAEPEITKL